MQTLSIVVPCHNEEVHIRRFTQELLDSLGKLKIAGEILFIENGSWDKTPKLLAEFEKKYANIKVMHIPEANFGLALKKGIYAAKGKYTVIFNVDYYDPRLLTLTKVDLLGYDMIICAKNLPASVDHRPLSRRLLTKAYNLLLRTTFGFHGSDTTGIRAVKTTKIRLLVDRCRAKSGVFDSELSIFAQKAGLSYLEIPVVTREVRASRFPSGRFKQTIIDLYSFYQEFTSLRR